MLVCIYKQHLSPPPITSCQTKSSLLRTLPRCSSYPLHPPSTRSVAPAATNTNSGSLHPVSALTLRATSRVQRTMADIPCGQCQNPGCLCALGLFRSKHQSTIRIRRWRIGSAIAVPIPSIVTSRMISVTCAHSRTRSWTNTNRNRRRRKSYLLTLTRYRIVRPQA